MNFSKYFIIIGIFSFMACSSSDDSANPNNGGGEWLIPTNQVIDGGPGRDGIPALENPEFISVDEATYLDGFDLVIGYKQGNDIRAYPHKILDWHEIINDVINNDPVAITYCPLTGTGIGWDREINGRVTTFGVSGLLYLNNLIPFDRATKSNWSQMLLQSVNGEFIGERIETFPVIETTWETWKAMYPDTRVVSTNTGFVRNYQRFPYGDYRTNNNNILFQFEPRDTRLEAKERVHGVIVDEEAKAYRFTSFPESTGVIEDTFKGVPIVIAGSRDRNFIVSFERILEDGTELSFTAVNNGGAVILEDSEGNQWNVLGEAVSGPRTGQRLIPTDSYIGYWFAWGAFFPAPVIFEFPG